MDDAEARADQRLAFVEDEEAVEEIYEDSRITQAAPEYQRKKRTIASRPRWGCDRGATTAWRRAKCPGHRREKRSPPPLAHPKFR